MKELIVGKKYFVPKEKFFEFKKESFSHHISESSLDKFNGEKQIEVLGFYRTFDSKSAHVIFDCIGSWIWSEYAISCFTNKKPIQEEMEI